MTTSSAQEDYSITLTDEQLAALNTTDTITLSAPMGSYCYSSGGSSVYTIGNLSTSTISFTNSTATASTYCIPTVDLTNISVWGSTEWVDSFPSWSRVEKMCEEYPGLRIAFEKFKSTYKLVQDDFDTPPEKRIKP